MHYMITLLDLYNHMQRITAAINIKINVHLTPLDEILWMHCSGETVETFAIPLGNPFHALSGLGYTVMARGN